MNKHKGFSLIELLVVVSVVGLLATLSTVGYTRVNNNSVNSTRETDAKLLAYALENSLTYNNSELTCTDITANPTTVAKILELNPKDIARENQPSQTRISCAKKPYNSDESFYVSGLGCKTIIVEYSKRGSSERGRVSVKGPAPTATCLYDGDNT